MRKILLTSAGFENPIIRDKFMELVGKDGKEIHALFITTAAVEVGAILVLPKCLEDLFSCGVLEENITVYDMHVAMPLQELAKYDVLYVCGGNTSYLFNRMCEVNFLSTLESYLEMGGVYLGVSAGSVAISGKYESGKKFLPNLLNVHCISGFPVGKINGIDPIDLTNNQAVLITEYGAEIIE